MIVRVVHESGGRFSSSGDITDRPCPTIKSGASGGDNRQYQVIDTAGPPVIDPETGKQLAIGGSTAASPNARRFTLGELRRICGFPDDFTLTGTYDQRWERLGRAVPPPMMAAIATAIVCRVLRCPGVPMSNPAVQKPTYRVPSMAEINALPWNGLTAASTFSGCGGSSLGYRMAGFRVLWASEFVPAARDTYLANAAPSTVVDDRDIRDVSAADVLTALGLGVGELDLLDGSPPCASFSTAGKRHEGWGKVKSYSDTAQRTDDLFYEYARLVRGIQPRVFVAENVSGLVKGTAKGYFIRIMTELRACGYRVQAKLLDAQWLGVPQARQRLILIGVRNDLGRDPAYPTPLPYRYSVREALPWVLEQGDNGGFGQGTMRPATVPSGTIGSSEPRSGNGRFPPSAVTVIHDTSGDRSTGDVTDRPCPTITVGGTQVNACHYQVHGPDDGNSRDPETGKDLRIPSARVFTTARYGEGQPRIGGGDSPAPTVTAVGIGAGARCASEVAIEVGDRLGRDPETGKDLRIGGSAIGRQIRDSDAPVVARRFTLGELRRICGFPDDFVLTGTYEQRWERMGRAVPPVMMAAIATAVRDRVLLSATVCA